MLQTIPAASKWAQVGWQEKAYDDRDTFVQFTGEFPYFYHYNFPPFPTDSFHVYEVTFDYSGTINFRVDGVFYFGTPAAFDPNSATISGETTTLATQMPGGYSHSQYREWFIFSKVRLGGAWSNFYRTPYNPVPQYFGSLPDSGNQAIYIWDKACPQ